MESEQIQSISLSEIQPLHEVRNPALVDELAADMNEHGWQGRPLLVIEREADYLAWTGSHRLPAADKAGFDEVPCYVVQAATLAKHGFDPEYGHVEDWERQKILEKIGDPAAVHLMWQEGRS